MMYLLAVVLFFVLASVGYCSPPFLSCGSTHKAKRHAANAVGVSSVHICSRGGVECTFHLCCLWCGRYYI